MLLAQYNPSLALLSELQFLPTSLKLGEPAEAIFTHTLELTALIESESLDLWKF